MVSTDIVVWGDTSACGGGACAFGEVGFTVARGGIKSIPRAVQAPSRFLAPCLGVGGSRAVQVCFSWAVWFLWFLTTSGEVRFTKASGGIKSVRAHKAPSRFFAP